MSMEHTLVTHGILVQRILNSEQLSVGYFLVVRHDMLKCSKFNIRRAGAKLKLAKL